MGLSKVVTMGDDLFAGIFKTIQGNTDILKLAGSGTDHFAQIKYEHFNALIVFSVINDIDNIF